MLNNNLFPKIMCPWKDLDEREHNQESTDVKSANG